MNASQKSNENDAELNRVHKLWWANRNHQRFAEKLPEGPSRQVFTFEIVVDFSGLSGKFSASTYFPTVVRWTFRNRHDCSRMSLVKRTFSWAYTHRI